MDHEHHGGHGTHGGDHIPTTGQLSPNEHRRHAEPDTHGGHGGGHEGRGAHAGMGTMPPSSGTGSGGACS